MEVFEFGAYKGGQGSSVCAAVVAVTLAERGARVLFVDPDGVAVCGGNGEVRRDLEVRCDLFDRSYQDLEMYNALVIGNSDLVPQSEPKYRTRRFAVTRACYLSLRRAANRPHDELQSLDGVILVEEPDRALSDRDVAAVYSRKSVVCVPWSATVARAVDAGLLVGRVPQALKALRALANDYADLLDVDRAGRSSR